MQQISNHLEQLSLTPVQTNYLEKLKDKLAPHESKIIQMKYTGSVFSKMAEEERWFAAQTLLLKIHAITGWTIPINEMMDILIDQFQRKLEEGYGNVTIAEVEYAFRNKPIDAKDWGKALNLSMIDEVMVPYLASRFEVSKTEEIVASKIQNQIDAPTELTDEDWNEWIKDIRGYDFKLIPCAAYDYLVAKGEINLTNQQKHEYMDRAIAHLLGVYEPMTKEMNDFLAMKKEGVFDAATTATLVTISKRFAISDYFKSRAMNE